MISIYLNISDFGLTKFRKNDDLIVDYDDPGSDNDNHYKEIRARVYQAPEFLLDEPTSPTAAGDVYSFSIILVEIATRNDPYQVPIRKTCH